MNDAAPADAVRAVVSVPLTTEQAFERFTRDISHWWPKEYTWSGKVLETIGIEPGVGGMCTERGPHGFRLDWGRVLVWEPPGRLVFTWQISPSRVPEPDPERSSEVEVRFRADGPQATRVELEHRGFSRHGEGAGEYQAGMASPQGWPYILERFAQAISQEE